VQLREIGAEFRGQDFANSLYFSLLAGNLGRKVSAKLLPLPFSLHCREISPNRPRNRRNRPYFAIVSMKPRAEKTLLSNDNAFYCPFSPGARRGATFVNLVGELLAITNRRLCELDLTSLCSRSCEATRVVPRVRIPLSPPYSLDCREIPRYCSENREKSPRFRDSHIQTGPEKPACEMQ
jgi:hypothetical protein